MGAVEPTTSTGLRAVVIDDDDMFRESLCRNLQISGYRATAFPDGSSGLEYLLANNKSDVVILDWHMPGLQGIDVLQRLRDTKFDSPVIFLTAHSDQIYEEAALLQGAVDFVEKSRSYTILRRRIELAVLGFRVGKEPAQTRVDDTLRFGNLVLDCTSHRAYWNEMEVPLTVNEFRIVEHLASKTGQDARYRELYDVIHGRGFVAGVGSDGYRSNVRAFIKRIREKFKAVDDDFAAIENYPGFGYRWREDDNPAA